MGVGKKTIDDATQQAAKWLPPVRLHVLELEGSVLRLHAIVCMNHNVEISTVGPNPPLHIQKYAISLFSANIRC